MHDAAAGSKGAFWSPKLATDISVCVERTVDPTHTCTCYSCPPLESGLGNFAHILASKYRKSQIGLLSAATLFSSFGCVALTLPNRIRVRSDVFTANLLETFQLADASKCLIKYTFQLKWMGFDFFPAAAFVIWLLAAVGPLDMIYHQLWARKLSAANMSCPQCS